MRTPLLAGITLLALSTPLATASSAPVTFGYTGAIVDYTVPATGQYAITAIGARGGNYLDAGGTGGLGAEAGGTFSLVGGEVLRILVGAAGADVAVGSPGFAGGGGGSFAVGPDGLPLLVAGGGGGGGQLTAYYPPPIGTVRGGSRYNGGDGLTGPDGGTSTVVGDASAGAGAGAGGTNGGNGQGGLVYAIGVRSAVNGGRGFNAFPSGLGAGAFGGGGLGSDPGGGGGGGYSGGGGGGFADFVGSARYGFGGGGGGGGGSFDAGADPFLLARIGTSDGSVAITPVATTVPEPAGLALFGTALATLLGLHRRR